MYMYSKCTPVHLSIFSNSYFSCVTEPASEKVRVHQRQSTFDSLAHFFLAGRNPLCTEKSAKTQLLRDPFRRIVKFSFQNDIRCNLGVKWGRRHPGPTLNPPIRPFLTENITCIHLTVCLLVSLSYITTSI